MVRINENFLALPQNYLFSEIAARVEAYRERHPGAKVISMGIGDVTLPLVPAVVEAMQQAVADCADARTFRGYGPEHGYDFLREAIVQGDYPSLGIGVEDIFVSDGSKSDTGNIGDIFSAHAVVGIQDPVYPVYLDTNVMAGRRIHFIPCDASNGYAGQLPEERLDLIYLCYPNNPTGATISREALEQWVDYARRNGSIILYDAAYEAYIRDPDIPHSIYEIDGARECAIEFRSFSKTAGFTGIRCGFTVVPRGLSAAGPDGAAVSLNHLWERRQCCKFNGASYVSQRGAAAVYSPEGKIQVRRDIDHYLDNAAFIRRTLDELGLHPVGGTNSPYIWAQTPPGTGSWDFFDHVLEHAGVVMTPGAGFGRRGEGFFRVTAYTERHQCEEAMQRLRTCIQAI